MSLKGINCIFFYLFRVILLLLVPDLDFTCMSYTDIFSISIHVLCLVFALILQVEHLTLLGTFYIKTDTLVSGI